MSSPKITQQGLLCPVSARSADDIGGEASTRSGRPLVLMVISEPPLAMTDCIVGHDQQVFGA